MPVCHPKCETQDDGTRVVTDAVGTEVGRYSMSDPDPQRVFVERRRQGDHEFECRVVNHDDYRLWCIASGIIPMGMLAASYERDEPNGELPDSVVAAAYGHGDVRFRVVVLDVPSRTSSED